MNKLIWSAFAMSLMLHTFFAFGQSEEDVGFLGLESEVLPELTGAQKFSPKSLHENGNWNVEVKQVVVDTEPLMGQGHSLIPWSELDSEDWLSVNKWLIQRSLRDKNPDWKIRLRSEGQNEHMGKVLQCRGICSVYRGTMQANVQHLSQVNEGDEFHTGPDSVAWVYLIDGSLVRIGPSSSVSFQEINWSKSEVFLLVRLQQGHIFWHNRSPKDYSDEKSPETDSISLPLLLREANTAWFERELFKGQSDFEQSVETMKQEETASRNQINKINELRKQNNLSQTPKTKVMVVAPNITLVGAGVSFDLFYSPGGKSYFKKRLGLEEHHLAIQLRGFDVTDFSEIDQEAWYEVESNGRSYAQLDNPIGALEIIALLTKRIKTIDLARELWFEKYTIPVTKLLGKPKDLAITFGYRLSDEEEVLPRFKFLVEYSRRMETTNLKSMERLLEKIEKEGRVVQKEVGSDHYQAALHHYLNGLKNRYTEKNQQVREMSDLQYYVWILRHDKK